MSRNTRVGEMEEYKQKRRRVGGKLGDQESVRSRRVGKVVEWEKW